MAIINVTKANFNEVINQNEKVLVDFWAPWCTPCRMLGEVLHQVSEERNDVVIAKVNVDENEELAREFKVSSIPFVVIYEKGKIVKNFLGYRNKEAILGELN